MTTEQEILEQEELLANAKRTLDLDALERIYAEDVVMTGVIESCGSYGKPAIMDEARRGTAQRQAAEASGRQFEASAENEDMKVTAHGNTAISSYRFVVKFKGQNIDVQRRYRATNVWMKRNGQWQIVAAHMSFALDANQAAKLSGEGR
jgi:ketosteroid isomerase-like protein